MKKRVEITHDSLYDIDGPLDKAIAHLQQRAAEFKKQGYEEVTVEFETKYGYYDDSWVEVTYYGVKPVTVKEFLESDEVAIHANHLKKKK